LTPTYSLTFELRPHYLFAIVDGEEDTVAISLAYWAEIAAECRRHHVSRLLVLEKLKAKSNNDDADMVIAELPRMFGDIRIAFVDVDESVDVLVHAEIEARKAGLVSHVFGSLEAARQWLLRDVDHEMREGARASR
jgi:hypothetical protein